jgi:hypothetical protein
MVTLRCTRKLLARVPEMGAVDGAEPPPTTALGDWFATIVFDRKRHIVVCVSERTLLPVLLPAAPLSGLPARLGPAVADMLLAIGISGPTIEDEVAEMSPLTFGRTNNRRVLGTLNDFLRMLPHELDRSESLLEAALWLAKAPCSVIGMESPRAATLQTLSRLH